MKKIFKYTIFTTILTLCLAGISMAAAFTGGNLVVCRFGDGAGAITNLATPVFLDEYTIAGALVQSIPLPVADSGANQILTASGTATSECLMTRSADGRYLFLMGYDAAVGTAAITSSSTTGGTPILRVIARVGRDGVVDTSTTTTSFSGGNPRGAVSSNGTDIWLTGSNTGVVYTTFGSSGAGTIISTTVTNNRTVNIFGGQLYSSDSSGAAVRLGTVGTGLPTTAGQTITNLPGFPVSGSPYNYFFADLTAAVAGNDTLYVADDAAGLQKYSLVAGSWVANGAPITPTIRGLTGSYSGGGVVTLFATTSTGGNLSTYTDATGYNVTPVYTASNIATAATNTVLRSVALVPLPVTAATATISGRVTEANGRPIANASLIINGGDLSQPITVSTGSMGYFSVSDLPVGQNYVITVSAKRHRFNDPVRVFTLSEDLTAMDFVAGGEGKQGR